MKPSIQPFIMTASNRLTGVISGTLLLWFLLTMKAECAIRTVTNDGDSGAGTLRQAIISASSGDTINFNAGITTINLLSGELLINKNLTIAGPGPNLLTIQRSSASEFRIFNISSATTTATISGLKITNGKALSNQSGAGISNIGVLTISNCIISGNLHPSDFNSGAGVYNGGLLTITDSNISGNSGVTHGGGISNGGNITITNCNISGNLSNNDGGGIYNTGTATIIKSVISGNSTGGYGAAYGGGIFNCSGSSMNVINSTISGNSVATNPDSYTQGGGMANRGTVTITNSTISNNSVSGNLNASSGGGIHNSGTLTTKNVIIALNSSQTVGPDVSGPLTSQGCNLIGNNTDVIITPAQPSDQIGTSAAPIDPLLGPLQDNGGPTFTCALLAGSPALDAGDDSVISPSLSLSTDQRGVGYPRKSGSHVDIGAFEISPLVPEIVIAQGATSSLLDGSTVKRSFGTIQVGKSSAAKTFTIKNIGSANLTGLAIAKDGSQKNDFIVTALTKTFLAPGTSTTFKVTFKPAAKNTRNAGIHIKSNDTSESSFDIKLTGIGS